MADNRKHSLKTIDRMIKYKEGVRARNTPKGVYVRRKRDAAKIYEFDGWCRTNRKYQLSNVDDINDFFYVGQDAFLHPCNLM